MLLTNNTTGPVTDDTVFTLVALPDTQSYSRMYPITYNAITRWISGRWDIENFDFIVHLGDIVDTPDQEQEWQNAYYAMSLLGGHPYTVLPGNHDFEPSADGNHDYSLFNKYFPASILTPHSNKGTFPPDTMINNYVEIKGYLILSIGFFHPYAITPPGLKEWIIATLSENSKLPVIVVTHHFLTSSGELDRLSEQLWNILKDFPNVFLVLSGHATAPQSKQETVKTLIGTKGNIVNAVTSNYQDYLGANSGYIRIYEITNNYINVKTFSPLINMYMVDNSSQFTLARQGNEVGNKIGVHHAAEYQNIPLLLKQIVFVPTTPGIISSLLLQGPAVRYASRKLKVFGFPHKG